METCNISFLNEYGDEVPVENARITFIQMLLPRENADKDNLSYKNCDSFEIMFDKRQPQVLFYLGDYMKNDSEVKNEGLKHMNYIKFNGITAGSGNGLMESYNTCAAIKDWCEKTMYLIGEECVKEVEDSLYEEVDEYCEESRKKLLDELYRLGKEEYEKRKTPDSINNKPQDNENN